MTATNELREHFVFAGACACGVASTVAGLDAVCQYVPASVLMISSVIGLVAGLIAPRAVPAFVDFFAEEDSLMPELTLGTMGALGFVGLAAAVSGSAGMAVGYQLGDIVERAVRPLIKAVKPPTCGQ